MKTKIAKLEKRNIEYTSKGDGPVILNLHGGHSNSQENFGYQPLLDAGYSILTPSRPGYGRTDVEIGKTAAQTAASLIKLLDHLEIDQVYLIGVSAGGPTAIYLAANYPSRIKKLVLESAASKAWLSRSDFDYKLGKLIFNPKFQHVTWFMLRKLANNFPQFFAKIFLPAAFVFSLIYFQIGNSEPSALLSSLFLMLSLGCSLIVLLTTSWLLQV